MKKQKKKITAYVLLVLLIIVIFVIRDNFFENGLLKKIYNEKATFTILKYPNNVSYLFLDYEGKIGNHSIYRSIYDFVKNEIPKYYSNLRKANDKEINNYYNIHKSTIGKILGIENKEDFMSFVKTIQKLETEELKLERYIINSDVKLEDTKEYYRFVLLVEYENNERIGFYIEIPKGNYSEKKTPVNYKGNVKQEELEYQEIVLEPMEFNKDFSGKAR